MKNVLEKVSRFVQSLLVGRSARVLSQPAAPKFLKPRLDYKKPKRKIDRVFIHCSASDRPEHDDIKIIEAWHIGRGFKGVGYHYFITNDGNVQAGRDLERIPAAQRDHNTGTIAICLHGHKKFNGNQLRTLTRLCQAINKEHDGKVTFHGHKEVNPFKACPVFDYKALLKLDERGKLGV